MSRYIVRKTDIVINISIFPKYFNPFFNFRPLLYDLNIFLEYDIRHLFLYFSCTSAHLQSQQCQ